MQVDDESALAVQTGMAELPQSLQLEQTVLGAMLSDQEYAEEGLAYLSEEDFYQANHRIIFEGISLTHAANLGVDIVTVSEIMKEAGTLGSGRTYLSDLSMSVWMSGLSSFQYHTKMLKDLRVRRDLIETGYKTVYTALEETDGDAALEKVQSNLLKLTENCFTKDNLYKASDLADDVLKEIRKRRETPNALRGLPTSWVDLDKMTCGLQKSDLIIIAARPSMGKTSFLLGMVEKQVVFNTTPTLVFSLEMSAPQLMERMVSALADVDSQKMRSGALTDDDLIRIKFAAERLSRAPLYIEDTPMLTPSKLRVKAKRIAMQTKGKLGLIAVDYLQLMTGGNGKENRTQEVSEITRALKGIAKELNVPVIALSQLSRRVEERGCKRPQMSDLRESGSIEQDADVIMFIYRDDYYNKTQEERARAEREEAEIILAKQRNGPVGEVKLWFNKPITRFENKA